MSSKTPYLIVIAKDRALGFDPDGGTVQTLPRAAGASAADALAELLDSAAVDSSKILLASTDFFTQTVRLPEARARGVTDEELAALLAYEIEPFSGIGANNGKIAFIPESASAWSALQIADNEIALLRNAAKKRGSAITAFIAAPDTLLTATDAELPAALLSLARDAALARPPFPTIAATDERKLPPLSQLAPALLLALALAACAAHRFVANGEAKKLRAEHSQLTALTAEVAALENTNRALASQIAAAEKRISDRAAAQAKAERYRSACAVFFTALAESAQGKVAVNTVKATGPFEMEINGTAADTSAPGAFLALLQPRIAAAGWRVSGERQQSLAFSFKAALERTPTNE